MAKGLLKSFEIGQYLTFEFSITISGFDREPKRLRYILGNIFYWEMRSYESINGRHPRHRKRSIEFS